MPGINCPTYYIGGAFALFPFCMEDEDLSSVTYVSSGAPKTWNGLSSSSKTGFDNSVAQKILTPEYANDHYGGVQLILATKKKLFDPSLVANFSLPIKVSPLVPSANQFVILGRGVYHEEFNTCYNVAKVTSVTDIFWSKKGRIAARNKKMQRLFIQCTLPMERILWNEAIHLLNNRCSTTFGEPTEYKASLG